MPGGTKGAMLHSFEVAIMCALVALMTSSCSVSPSPRKEVGYDPAASIALNITRMAGLDGLVDQDDQKFPGATGGVEISDVGYAATSALNPPPGFGGGAGVAMGVLSLFTASPRQVG